MKVHHCLTAALIATLAACSSPKDASEDNFARVINDHYARECILVNPRRSILITEGNGYPLTVELDPDDAEDNAGRTAQYQALVQAGLLKGEQVSVEKRSMFGKPRTIPVMRYSLTDTGMQAYQQSKDETGESQRTGFCAGYYRVDTIKRFSEPGAFGPYTVSEVAYSFSPQEVPSWAGDAALQSAMPQLAKALQTSQDGKTTLILTNEGWVHQADFDE